jgi:uncharacterized membrane protein (UPF0127 family)
VRVLNRTRQRLLHAQCRLATSALAQTIGLMFRRPGAQDALAFIFPTPRRVRFHMWFVFGSIDIIALDADGHVLAQREWFRPWTYWSPGVDAMTVIELPAGTIARTGTALGDRLTLTRDAQHNK